MGDERQELSPESPACQSCGAGHPARARFCPACGARIGGDAPRKASDRRSLYVALLLATLATIGYLAWQQWPKETADEPTRETASKRSATEREVDRSNEPADSEPSHENQTQDPGAQPAPERDVPFEGSGRNDGVGLPGGAGGHRGGRRSGSDSSPRSTRSDAASGTYRFKKGVGVDLATDGVTVTSVEAGSLAAKWGVKKGDMVYCTETPGLAGYMKLDEVLDHLPADFTTGFVIVRDGKPTFHRDIVLPRGKPSPGKQTESREPTSAKSAEPREPASDSKPTETLDQHSAKIAEALRQFARAQSNWRRFDTDMNGANDYLAGPSVRLSRLHEERTDGLHVNFISEPLARADALGRAEPYWGYLFRGMHRNQKGRPYAGVRATEFGIVAYPAKYGKTGRRTFIVNESGSVYSRDISGRVPVQWPKGEPITNGWIKEIHLKLPPLTGRIPTKPLHTLMGNSSFRSRSGLNHFGKDGSWVFEMPERKVTGTWSLHGDVLTLTSDGTSVRYRVSEIKESSFKISQIGTTESWVLKRE